MRRAGLVLAAACTLLAFAAPAQADLTLCSAGSAPGQCSEPQGIAVDFETQRVYVADQGNKRIDVFKANGEFITSFGSFTTAPTEIAVDNSAGPSHHAVYVADGNQVKKFSSAGAELLKWGKGGTGPGEFKEIQGIGVTAAGIVYVADANSLGTGACPAGEVELTKRVQKFNEAGVLQPGTFEITSCSGFTFVFAADSAGNFYLGITGATRAIRKYDSAGKLLYVKEENQSPTVSADELAVDELDNLIAAQFSAGYRTVTKYAPSGAYLRRYGYGSILAGVRGVAGFHSAFGDAFLSEVGSQGPAKYLAEPPPGPIAPPSSLEADPIGNAKATLNAEVNPEGKATEYRFQYVDQKSFEDEAGFASPNTKTTPLAAIPIKAGSPEEEVDSFKLHKASAQIGCANAETETASCLAPETTYRFRLLAENPDGKGNLPLEGPAFTTKAPVEIIATYATEVGTDSARINAQVNPLGIPASGYFEYVDDATYQLSGFASATKVPAGAELDLGGGESPVTRSVLLALDPATTYHYRFVATDILISPKQTIGPERTVTTFPLSGEAPSCEANQAFRVGPSALLPDCRAYEMVSPVDKEGGEVAPPFGERLDQSAASGNALTYTASHAPGPATQHLASRGAGGWSSATISPPQEIEARAFSADLCQSWWRAPAGGAKLAPKALEGAPNLYRHRDGGCPPSGWEALSTATPPHGSSGLELQGTSADGGKAIYLATDNLTPDAPDFGGGLPSLYYQSQGEGPPRYLCILPSGEPHQGLCTAGYDQVGDLKGRSATLQNAISSDGERVFWSASEPGGGPKLYVREHPGQPQSALSLGAATGTGKVTEGSTAVTALIAASGEANFTKGSTTVTLLKTTIGKFVAGQPLTAPAAKLPAGTTVAKVEGNTLTLSAAAGETGAAKAISSKGPMPFAVGQAISGAGIPIATTITEAKSGELKLSKAGIKTESGVELSATSPCTEPAKACTIAVSQEAEELSGTSEARFWAASDDGSAALFTAFNGSNGTSDLYRFNVASRKTILIAHKVLGLLGASEDLSRIYLVSEEALTGPNAQGKSPTAAKPNLYLRTEGAPGSFNFVATLGNADAASYDPRPSQHSARVAPDGLHAAFMSSASLTGYDNADAATGKADTEVFLYDATAAGKLLCASCNPSGARPLGREVTVGAIGQFTSVAGEIPTWQTSLYPGRVLSDDGQRLYFDSTDALSPRDTNAKADVYEWEAAGAGGCEVGGTDYFAQSQGCISLISSGKAPAHSTFIDASPAGDDVFLATGESLSVKDPGAADLYDARVDGGFAGEGGEEEEAEEFALTVKTTGTGTGTVTSSPAGIDCGSDCEEEYDEGTAVTLTGAAGPNSKAVSWTGCDSVDGESKCHVTMTSAREVTATFALEQRLLTIKKAGTGTGKVSSSPAGIDCGSTCSALFDHGTEVTLTAKADPGSIFKGWSGAGCSGTATCKVTMSEAKEASAEFAKEEAAPTHKLTLATEGTGSGTVTSSPGLISCSPFCSDDFAVGTKVTLTATPTPGSTFYSWKRCDAGGVNGRQCTVAMDKAKSVSAVFSTTHELTLSKEGGMGKVQSYPGGILCLANCSETTAAFLEGAKVSLKATPSKRFALAEWTGDCTGTGACELTMGEGHEVGALFAEVPKHLLTLAKTGGGAGTVKSEPAGLNCGLTCATQASSFYEGDKVTLTAIPGKGSSFAGWSGCDSEAEGKCEVTVAGTEEVQAEFK